MLNYSPYFSEAVEVLPSKIRSAVLSAAAKYNGSVYEIRLYADSAVTLTTDSGTLFVTSDGTASADRHGTVCPSFEDTEQTLLRAAGYSPFAHEDEIKNGYITFGGGIRAGFGGSGEDGCPTIKGVTSVNIRIPCRLIDDASDNAVSESLLAVKNGLLAAGEPGSGKTTFLKKAIRCLTDNGRRVCVIDERRELFGAAGLSRTSFADVISGGSKESGIMRALRLMSPEYIVCDEIGTGRESEAMKMCLNSGVKFIASIHAADIGQLVRRSQFITLFSENIFDRVLFLDGDSPGKIKSEYTSDEVKNEICRTYYDMPSHGAFGDNLRNAYPKESNDTENRSVFFR